MKTRFIVPIALLLTACHTAGSTDIGAGPERSPARIYARTGIYNATTYDERQPEVIQIAASPTEAWSALPKAYAELGIPVDAVEASTQTMGTTSLVIRRQLGSAAISTFLDCGVTFNGVNANTHQITLFVMTSVEPAAAGSSLRIRVAASAQPIATTGSVFDCTPTGRLEQRIAELVTKGD